MRNVDMQQLSAGFHIVLPDPSRFALLLVGAGYASDGRSQVYVTLGTGLRQVWLGPLRCSWTESGQKTIGTLPALCRRESSIALGSENKVTLGEPVDLVGPNLDPDLAPAEVDVRMMLLIFGNRADPIGECQRLRKVAESKGSTKVMVIDRAPPGVELRE